MLDDTQILQSILDNSPDGIVIVALDFKILHFNQVIKNDVFEILNKKMQIGDDIRDFISPHNKVLFISSFLKAAQGENVESEGSSDRRSLYFNYEYRFMPIYDENRQNVIGIYFFVRNITKEKKAEKEIERLNDTIDSIFRNTTESFVILDKDYALLYCNKVAANKIKQSLGREISIGADFRDFIYEGKGNIFKERFQKTLEGENFVSEEEIRNPNGKSVWVKTRMQPLYGKSGEILGVSIFWNFITERKLAEIALQESEEKFRKIVESTPVPIIITDEKLNIVLANLETEKVFDYTFEELSGKNIRILIPDRKTDNKSGNIWKYLKEQTLYNFKEINYTPGITKNAESLIMEITLKRFRFLNKKYFIVIIKNITQRVEHEQLIAEQIRRLETIAWHHSHVMRRPVANILGVFNLLQLSENETEKQEYLVALYESIKELDDIIHEIVDNTYIKGF